jgi:DNA-binding CsgD family transcriptional regulator
VELAEGNPQAALASLRRAFEVWQRLEAPYAAARVRVLMGLACRGLGDEDTAGLELDAARSTFERLGAAPDLARLHSVLGRVASRDRHPLTARELQVLRLVAAGKTNGAVAAELFLSERTIERHLSNIFNKLEVATRTAATAWAYEHGLI